MTGGTYIVIEGSDGTGKTTQLYLLRDYFLSIGRTVHITSEPADPHDEHEPLPIARELRKLIKNGDISRDAQTNLLLFTAARVEKWRSEIAPALERGEIVLSSRNYWSTLAYQGYGEGLSTALILQQTKLYFGNESRYLHPDAAVILAMSDETERQQRVQKRGLHKTKDTFETKDQTFQTNIARGYTSIAKDFNLPLVDAGGSPSDVHARIRRAIETERAT